MKIDIAGVLVDNVSKQEALSLVNNFLNSGGPHYLVTPYSEQIVFAINDPRYKKILNQANLALPDGIGILWAAKYLSLKGIFWPFVKTLLAIILAPKYIRSVIRQRVTGSEFIYDLARFAQENNFSFALVGGTGNVAAQAAYELKKLYPGLRINLALSGRPFDQETVKEISTSNSDILLLAYSPPKQEAWIAENLPNLNVKLAAGLGGTFDYVAKVRPSAPKFMRYMGLEWLWRLITQPWRVIRMWNAVPVFAWKILKYKLHVRNSN